MRICIAVRRKKDGNLALPLVHCVGEAGHTGDHAGPDGKTWAWEAPELPLLLFAHRCRRCFQVSYAKDSRPYCDNETCLGSCVGMASSDVVGTFEREIPKKPEAPAPGGPKRTPFHEVTCGVWPVPLCKRPGCQEEQKDAGSEICLKHARLDAAALDYELKKQALEVAGPEVRAAEEILSGAQSKYRAANEAHKTARDRYREACAALGVEP